MTKQGKADLVNEAVQRSEVALRGNYRAVVKDGKLIYLFDRKSATTGHVTTCRSTLREVLHKLQGEDIRRIKAIEL